MSSSTLRSLLARPDLQLRLITDETPAVDAPIQWVHSTDLADPTPFLSDGLVLLTTGTQFRGVEDDAEVYRDYVDRLAHRGVLGLGFGTAVIREGIPALLEDACRAAGIALFEVPYRTPFIAVARANAEAVAAESFARRNWALSAQRAIALAALRPDGLAATIAELARQLDAWIGVYDPSGILTRQQPPGRLDTAAIDSVTSEVAALLRRGARSGVFPLDGVPASLYALGAGGTVRGIIAIVGADLDRAGRDVVTSVIAMAGLALEQNVGLSRAVSLLRTGVFETMCSGDVDLARRISARMWGDLPSEPIRVVFATHPSARSGTAREWLELRASEQAGRVFPASIDDATVIVLHEDDPLAEEFAERFDSDIGVSSPATYAELPAALEQARVALARRESQLTRFDGVPQLGLRAALGGTGARAVADAYLAPLRGADVDHVLEETLMTWLHEDARIDRAAVIVGVHRHTVRARIAQAERLLGTNLASFRGRAELWAALAAATPRSL